MVSKHAAVTGKDLVDARPDYDRNDAKMIVSFTLTPQGGDKFYAFTSRNFKRPLAAVLDDVVVTVATINAKIREHGSISGGFDAERAKELALLLRSGSFVAPISFEEERQIGPTLGTEAIHQGIIACIIALVGLFVFSVAVYKVAGLFAFIALLYNLVFILLGLAWIHATLTLPGIAGMVLTVGMAIDASILIYERIKEELAAGVPLRKAVDDGFSDAMRVILDANITTFITGLVLYKFGTGPIQGFAITMMLGIVATLITGLFFLKSIFTFVINVFNVQKISI
jgi:preprotein translocase subunit SecD